MFRAHLETRNFTFEAYGETKNKAYKNMKATIQAHARDYNGSPTEMWSLFREDVCTYEIKVGLGLRDREEIRVKKS